MVWLRYMTISREGFGTPVAGMERISWVAVHDKQNGVIRMTTWSGVTKRIVVIGLPPGFVGDCPCSFALPTGAEVHEWPMHAEDGVVFTVLADRPEYRTARAALDPQPAPTARVESDLHSEFEAAILGALRDPNTGHDPLFQERGIDRLLGLIGAELPAVIDDAVARGVIVKAHR